MDFDNPTIEQFIFNWFRQKPETHPFSQELIDALFANRRFLELARNPLLLLLIVDYYERDRDLPQLRADLYEHCVRTRVTRWNTVRGTHRGRFGERNKLRMLRELALHLFTHEGRSALIEWEDLLTWVDGFTEREQLPDGTTAEDLLDEVVKTSGLIQEKTIGHYGYSHLTLQEYFVADALARRSGEECTQLLQEHLDNERWREVIPLYAGLAEDAGPLLRMMVRRAASFDTGQGKAAWLQAGRTLAEGAREVEHEVRGQAVAGLVALLRAESSDPAHVELNEDERTDILELLGEIGQEQLTAEVTKLLTTESDDDALLAGQLWTKVTKTRQDADVADQIRQRMALLTRSEDAGERRIAAQVLGRSGEADERTIAALVPGLNDSEAQTRRVSAISLGQLGQVDDTTAQHLLTLYHEEPEGGVAHAALEALLDLERGELVDMLLIPGGEFIMGPDRDADKKEQHTIYVSAFYMDRTPVTNAQFRRFMEAGGYEDEAYWQMAIEAQRWQNGAFLDPYDDDKPTQQPRYWTDAQWNGDNYPVVGISWYEALAYANWAGKRLPTEAEWEKAARGTDGWIYPWGDDWDPQLANTKEGGKGQTTPVGAYSPDGDSPYGLVDMAGNVFEWCGSRYESYPYNQNDGREDLSGGDRVRRVLRGCSWAGDKEWVAAARRLSLNPWRRLYDRGFRCCCATSSSLSGSES